jgi:hypothetical protein
MSDCKKCRDVMIEALYGELGPADQEALARHRAACPACADEYESLRGTLELMDKRERPDPGPDFWDGYWDRLSRRLIWETTGETRRPSLLDRLGRLFPRLPRWSYQLAGAAALVLVGILIGRVIIGPSDRTGKSLASTGPAAAGASSSASLQAADFVERSKVLLLGLVNYDPAAVDAGYALDLDRKKALSRELAAGAPALRHALAGSGQKRLRDLVADLEVILMQIANLGVGQDVEGLEIVKQGVDQRGIFLRIDLDRLGRDARAAAAPAPSGTAGTPQKKRI